MRKRSLSPLRLLRTGLFVVGVGLIGAVLLHIVIILALPRFTGGDAYSRVLGLYEMDSFFPLSAEPGPTGLANDDPYLRVAVCGFSVANGPSASPRMALSPSGRWRSMMRIPTRCSA